jgi:diguanylate cyclase (GGDEF)-like protein
MGDLDVEKPVIFAPPSNPSSFPGGEAEEAPLAILDQLIERLDRLGAAMLESPVEACTLANEAMNAAVLAEREVSALRERIARLERLAVTDELTGVLNRRGFENELERALASARRYGEEGVLVYVDLDGFKEINDTYGHAAGDAALQEVATLLTANTRLTDAVGRLGGDEFAVLLKRTNWLNGVGRARALGKLLDPALVSFGGRAIEIRASIGAEPYTATAGGDGADLLARADMDMYERKQQRRPGPRPALKIA